MYDNSKYAYIVGRLRALDTKMMNQNLLERLVDAQDAQQAFRVLNDMPLVMGNMGDFDAQNFHKVLNGAIKEMQTLMMQMAPYPELLNFLWYKYDFYNLKLALKVKLTERGYQDIEYAFIDLGTVSLEEWSKYLLEDKMVKLTGDLPKVIDKARVAYEKSGETQVVDQIIDNYYLEMKGRIARQMGSALISRYLKRLVDFTNLKSFIRCMELKKGKEFLSSVLLSGGHVAVDTYLNSFERGYEDLKQALEKVMHADDLVKAIDRFIEKKTIFFLEKKIHDLQKEFMADSVKVTFGPEPVIAFFNRFENHMLIIRTVMVGKLNKLPSSDIAQHVLAL